MVSAAPRVSIVMATYNWASVLPYSIGSVLRQSWPDFELLVVGDGCTDNSAEVVASIGDERVRWIGLGENSGHQSVPTNTALAAARGEIIAYLGHDDLWLPEHLAALLGAIDAGADLAYSVTRRVSPSPLDDPLCDVRSYRPGEHIPPSSLAHRRTVIDEVGGWRHYRELTEHPETDLWRRAHAAGFRFAQVPRMTAVKFPAGLRPNVYRERPCHEQAAWFERICRDPHLGTTELLDLARDQLPPHRMYYRELVGHLWHETWRRLRLRLTPVRAVSRAPGAGVDELRRIKGLAPLEHAKVVRAAESVAAADGGRA